jgi:hypothetical protein
VQLDSDIRDLAEQLKSMLAIANECQDLRPIRGQKDVLVDIASTIISVSSLIDEYTEHGFVGELQES